MTDNLDLQLRRKRVGLNQRAVAKALGLTRPAYISDFENGHSCLPHGLDRKDYEAVLTAAEKAASKQSGGGK